MKYYVVFALEPFHCVEAFAILTDHVLFFFFMGYFLQAVTVRPVAGGGAGGAQAPPEIFRHELNSATKVEFFY